ncbi:MAG: photosystem II S4 domain protein [Cyanobacteria bacterium M_surface_10_m2_119]|nr:photosystem II S4 domain protein [Cyanobacteria bacterium M_surface_10_m2_119]
MLPRRTLLAGSRHPETLAAVLEVAESVLRTWEPGWTGFVGGEEREEIQDRLGSLTELALHGAGGFAGAERQRLVLVRRDAGLDPSDLEAPLSGVEISGNFLFDPAEPEDLLSALLELGLPAEGLGDFWVRGDRGGQGVIGSEQIPALASGRARVRSVDVELLGRPVAELTPPQRRQPRRLHTVEASSRLDAVASAGFGLPRNRMAELIRSGQVRVNWQRITTPSRDLVVGDRVQLQGKGELAVEEIQTTKRDRLRIGLLRQ